MYKKISLQLFLLINYIFLLYSKAYKVSQLNLDQKNNSHKSRLAMFKSIKLNFKARITKLSRWNHRTF